jgi:voltage-gated potassium channel Kch
MTPIAPDAVDLLPLYRPLEAGRWRLTRAGPVLCRGYWGAMRLVPQVAALLRDDETWMSLSPLECESQQLGIDHARGHVVVFGLGMGWSAATSALRPQVTRVTVVERDPEVIALHRALGLFDRLPGGAGSKVGIVAGDALAWTPDAPVDLLMPDIWLWLVSDGRVAEVRRMQDNVASAGVYFWGQELEIARHARAAGRALDADGIAATVAGFGLPLVGWDAPDAPARIAAAADAWMRDRWALAA